MAHSSRLDEGNMWVIDTVFVDEKYRKKGVG
jgi:hypothetical protein